MGSYENMWGRIKKKKIQLRFIDSIRFMASSLDSLSRNLVGTNEMMCRAQHECGSKAKFMHIDENYVAHGMCGKCGGASHQKLKIDLIF